MSNSIIATIALLSSAVSLIGFFIVFYQLFKSKPKSLGRAAANIDALCFGDDQEKAIARQEYKERTGIDLEKL